MFDLLKAMKIMQDKYGDYGEIIIKNKKGMIHIELKININDAIEYTSQSMVTKECIEDAHCDVILFEIEKAINKSIKG